MQLSIKDAKINEELISVSDSQFIDFIDDITQSQFNPQIIEDLRKEIKTIRKKSSSLYNKRDIRKIYQRIDELSFIPHFINVVMDRVNDFDRANKGFKVNGIRFKRLLATTGGAKSNTVMYVDENIYDELMKKIDNGRNKKKPIVPAKLEAYRSLVCSSANKVPNPMGVLVVKDCVTSFKADIIHIEDGKDGRPNLRHITGADMELEDSDGYGLISPTTSFQWAQSLNEDYTPSGFCVRNSFCKGMLFTFDFHEFSKKVAGKNIVVDAWGKEHDINDIDIILTTSMLKLWDSYDSIDEYLACCEEHGHSFRVTKLTPKHLDNVRTLNYQFIQSLHLNDQQIRELVKPTVDEIKDVLGGDYRKTIIYLKGRNLTEDNINLGDTSFSTALMADKRLINDKYVQQRIKNMIHKRITQAKTGVLNVEGNWSTVSGDPYSLCQSIFDLKVTGLLKEGEYYNNYWNSNGVSKVATFRAPMTCHNNIRIFNLVNTEEMQYWYRYMDTITIFNSWDTSKQALNGCDCDGDTVFTTNNAIILKGVKQLPAIVCQQRTAVKKVPTEEDLIASNKASFGDDIGAITNRVTSMFEVLANYEEGSPEYDELMYRIMCGQHFQQNAIDKAKGVIADPMPKEWYSYSSNRISEDDDEDTIRRKEFNLRILVDKKPYFFNYIYSNQKRRYKHFVDSFSNYSKVRFGRSIEELKCKKMKSKDESDFISRFKESICGNSPCIMNKVCWLVENQFEDVKATFSKDKFDHQILKTQTSYSKSLYNSVAAVYKQYRDELCQLNQRLKEENLNSDTTDYKRSLFRYRLKKSLDILCPDSESLCNIIVDQAYSNKFPKQMMWDLCGKQIIYNLLNKNNNTLWFPERDKDGDITYGGDTYKMSSKEVILKDEHDIG